MSLRDQIPVGVTEDDHPYNGPLSTYVEWHAATIGAGLMLSVVGAYVLLGRAAALPLAVAWLRLSAYAVTGKRLELPRGLGQLELMKRYMAQIREEPHYYYGGSMVVLAVAAAWLGVLP